MYLKFYGLNEEPFQITLDPEFYYPSLSHSEALALMAREVEQRKGFVVLTGEVGVGKTIIVHIFTERCRQQQIKVIDVPYSRVTFGALMNMIYKELGFEMHSEDIAELFHRFYLFLVEEQRQGRNVVLVIDEAQNMSINTLEDLRKLSDLENVEGKLIQILLVGQPELETKLNLKELRQSQQRIGARIRIAELTPEECLSYIRHRLTKAGMQVVETTIFTRAALRLIVKQSLGIPRKINIICDNALQSGFAYGKKPVSVQVVKDVIADLDGKLTRVSVKWVVTCACLGFLFLVIAGFAIARIMIYYKGMDSKHSPSVTASHLGGVGRPVGSASSVSTPVSPDDTPVPQSAPSSSPVPDSQSASVAPTVESLKSQGGVTAGHDSTVSPERKSLRNNEEDAGKTDISISEPKASLPASSNTASGKITGPADHAVQKADKPMRGEDPSDSSGSTTSKPRNASEEDPPDPNKLMDWFLNKRAR